MIGKDISNINACKIEALLSSLNRKLQLEQTRDLRNTTAIHFMLNIFLQFFGIFSQFLEFTCYHTSISP